MKIKIFSLVAVILFLIAGISGYFIYQKIEKEKNIANEINKISEFETTFSKTTDHEEKINILKDMIKQKNNYEKSEDSFVEVFNAYQSAISTMQDSFAEEYNSIINENTLNNLNLQNDIDIINTSSTNLTSLLSVLKDEKDYTLSSEEEYEIYNQKITELIESYSSRIAIIENEKKKAEEEAKRKAEEEAKRKAEEEAKRKTEEEQSKTHYENDYFSIDVPADWADRWHIEPTENTLQKDNPRVIAAYSVSCEPRTEYGDGGGAIIHVLKVEQGDKLGYGYFAMPNDAVHVLSSDYSNGTYVFIMAQAGSFFFDGGATITAK